MQKKELINQKNNITLTQFLKENNFKFPVINRALRKKDILVNNERVSESVVLKSKDKVVIFFADEKFIDIKIVYEDENILVVNKPSGLETTIKDAKENSLEQVLNSKEESEVKAVHRLDRNTEGLTILAKNSIVEKELIECFKRNEVEKIYTAKVFGVCDFKEKTFKANLEKNSEMSLVKILNKPSKNSVLIQTNVKVIKTNENFTLLEVKIFGGKTHQIRAHLAYLNFPIVGDLKYGNKVQNKGFKQMCLTASELKFKINSNSFLNYLNNKKLFVNPTWEF